MSKAFEQKALLSVAHRAAHSVDRCAAAFGQMMKKYGISPSELEQLMDLYFAAGMYRYAKADLWQHFVYYAPRQVANVRPQYSDEMYAEDPYQEIRIERDLGVIDQETYLQRKAEIDAA